MAGSYATAANQTCVRIASSATLRRRFAQKTKDTGFCYPCPPTLLLPISPAAQFSHFAQEISSHCRNSLALRFMLVLPF